MQTSVINGIPMYQNEDPIDRTSQDKAQVGAIDSRLPSRFPTVAAANSAYNAYTAQGGTLVDGMLRVVGGYIETYRAGGWKGLTPVVRQQTVFFDTTFNSAAEAGVGILDLPDLGHPVVVDCSGMVTIYANAGTLVSAQIRLDAVGGTLCSGIAVRDGSMPNGAGVTVTFPPYQIGPISGAHRLICTVQRTGGTGNWSVIASGNFLRANLTGP